MKRWLPWIIGVPLALVVLVSGGTWVYLNLVREPAPERLSLDGDDETDDAETDDTDTTATTTAPDTAAGLDGEWKVAEGSKAGYRVDEILNGQSAEAVGRTDDVTGGLTLAGNQATAGSFTVDMTTVASDESRRDNQFRGRIMDVATHPTSTFRLTAPVDFGEVPAVGARITATATGELTLKGRTNPVTFPLLAVRTDAGFEVAGSIPITFADYGIANPSAGPAQVGDEGELEFLLVFSR